MTGLETFWLWMLVALVVCTVNGLGARRRFNPWRRQRDLDAGFPPTYTRHTEGHCGEEWCARCLRHRADYPSSSICVPSGQPHSWVDDDITAAQRAIAWQRPAYPRCRCQRFGVAGPSWGEAAE